MSKLIRSVAFFLAIVALSSSSLLAQPAFEAEVDCDGFFNGGDTVPLTLVFTNQTSDPIALRVRLGVEVPLRGRIKLLDRAATLPPNRTITHVRDLTLPLGAPNGEYTVLVAAESDTMMTFDTCSFHVQ